jgi:hypothetical protein
MKKCYKTTQEHMGALISSGQTMLRANWVEHGLNIAVHMSLEPKLPNHITLGRILQKKGLEISV